MKNIVISYMNKQNERYKKIIILILLLASFLIFVMASEARKTKLDSLNIQGVKMLINNIEFDDNSLQYGIDLYVDTKKYELDSDNYFIKPIFPEADNLNKYASGAKRNIPQKVSSQSTLNVCSDFLDEKGYLKQCVGNMYEITLELYKGETKLDSKTYQVLCEAS